MSAVFIVGCSRSGTTSMLEVLKLSSDSHCEMEPFPNLNHESRDLMDGRLSDPYAPLVQHVVPRVAAGLARKPVYVEKQVSLVPFIEYLAKLLNCKFIIMRRDGRDVVSSLINWHNQMFPIIYQECSEPADLSDRPRAILAEQTGPDPFDYSLPRPHKGDPWHEKWPYLTRFEMVTWYWARINEILLEQMAKLDPSRYLVVDYTDPRVPDLKTAYEFAGLDDFEEHRTGQVLARKVNSLKDRGVASPAFPYHDSWSDLHKQRFNDIAFDTMKKVGYTDAEHRPPPPGFGQWWSEEEQDDEWYKSIYDYRRPLHEMFHRWLLKVEQSVGQLSSVIEVGCGTGHGYTEWLTGRRYVGIDLCPKAIELCRARSTSDGHSFLCCDIIASQPDVRADLVFSHATIDNVYDMNAFLKAMARMATKLLYVTNYRGYSPELGRHRYQWDPNMRVFFNDIAPSEVAPVLRAEGFETVAVFPQRAYRDDVVAETVIVASRAKVPESALLAEHEPYFEHAPYRAQCSGLSVEDVLRNMHAGCHSFCDGVPGLANDLSYFDDVVASIQEMSNIRPGTMADLALGKGGVNLGVRADVDMDIAATVEMALIAGERGFPLSFYLTHTASYYGSFADGVFRRNECLAPFYQALQGSGAEVGLHVDPYAIYLTHGIDGAEAVQAELAWLREQGLTIRGTSAHNAAPLYGVENFEIFAERAIRSEGFVLRNWRFLPLGVLHEGELGLSYEAGDATPAPPDTPQDKRDAYLRGFPDCDFVRDYNWFRTYILENPYCTWGYSYNIWAIGRDTWTVAGTKPDGTKVFQFKVGWEAVARFLRALGEDETCAMVIHPVYMGLREQPDAWPTGARSRLAQALSEPAPA